MLSSRWVARLFVALATLQLVPIWAPSYFPTTDGPSHVYNAVVMRELLLRHPGPIAETFALDFRPHPNVLGHIILAMLLGVFHGAAAEKILVSIIVLLFLGGAWMLAGAADPRGHLYAFFAFPLAFHELLQYGFYNYALSAAIYLVALALWWTRRDRPDGQTIALIALLTLLCYASHPASTLLLIGSIGVLWLLTLRGRPLRRHGRHLIAFIPVLPFLAWFFAREQGIGSRPSLRERLVFLAQCDILRTFDLGQLALGTALMIVLGVLIVVTLAVERRRRDENAFGVLTFVIIVLYLLAPDDAAGGQFVPERFAVLIPLLPLPWLTPRLPRWACAALVAILSVIAVGNALYLAKHERAISQRTAAFVRAERTIPGNSIVLALNAEQWPTGARLPLLGHVSGYAAAERKFADLDNYEAFTGYFPVTLRPGRPVVDRVAVESDPARFDATTFSIADYVFVWHIGDDAPVVARLANHYLLTAISPEARIYRRRDANEEFAELLLPIAGTRHPIDGTDERWNVEQTVTNRGSRPFEVLLSACSGMPCDFLLSPGESRRIASEPDRPFIIARIPRPNARDVTVRTIVERDGRDGAHAVLAVPSMPLTSFPRRSIDILCVPLSGRVRLRVWVYGAAPPEHFQLAAYNEEGTKELKRLTIARPSDGYFSGDVTRLFAPLQGNCVRVRIDAGAPDAAVWGFVSETGRGDAADALYLPRTSEYHP